MDPVDSSRQPKGPVSLQQPSSIRLFSANVGKGPFDYGQVKDRYIPTTPTHYTTQGALSKEPQRSLFRPPQLGSQMDPQSFCGPSRRSVQGT